MQRKIGDETPFFELFLPATTAKKAIPVLNTSYFSERVALFAIAMGVALVLAGIGFLVLTIRVLRSVG